MWRLGECDKSPLGILFFLEENKWIFYFSIQTQKVIETIIVDLDELKLLFTHMMAEKSI